MLANRDLIVTDIDVVTWGEEWNVSIYAEAGEQFLRPLFAIPVTSRPGNASGSWHSAFGVLVPANCNLRMIEYGTAIINGFWAPGQAAQLASSALAQSVQVMVGILASQLAAPSGQMGTSQPVPPIVKGSPIDAVLKREAAEQKQEK